VKKSIVKSSSLSATKLWLVRHAEVEERYQGVFGGTIDMELSARGHEQAAALAGYLHRIKLDALYASPMRRVQQTLAPFLVNGAPKPIIRAELREVDFGIWTSLTFGQVQERFGINVSAWLDQLECGGIPEAECAKTFQARVEPCLRQIIESHPGQQVGIACHGGVIRMLLAILLGWPLSRMAAFEFDYASVTQVVCGASRARLQLVNFTPWKGNHRTTGLRTTGPG
jgi:broad specificity phosphatase PhoE